MKLRSLEIADSPDQDNEVEFEVVGTYEWLSLTEVAKLRDHIDQLLKKQEAGE